MEYASQIEKLQRLWQENLHGTMFAPLAEAYRKAGMFEDALGALEIGLARHPKYVPGHIVLGRCFLDLRDDTKADETFTKVTDLDPENVIALKSLADIAERQGRREVAIERLERLLNFDPANDDAATQLARVKAELPAAPADAALPPAGERVARGEVIDPAKADFEVQIFQPLELVPSEQTEYQVPNDAESLRIRESGPYVGIDLPRVVEPTVEPTVDPTVDLSVEPPADPGGPAATAAALEEALAAFIADDATEPEPSHSAAAAVGDAAAPEAVPPVPSDPSAHVVASPSMEPTPEWQPPTLEPVEPDVVAFEAEPPEPEIDLTAFVAEEPPAAGPEVVAPVAGAEEPPPELEMVMAVVVAVATETPSSLEPEIATPAAVGVGATRPEPPAAPIVLTLEPTRIQLPIIPPLPPERPAVPTPEPVAVAAEPADLTAAEPSPASADVPTMDAILAGTGASPAEEEAPSAAEPELVVTETMAEIFLRQGYQELALAVYSQLAAREPDNEAIGAAKARLQAKLTPPAPEPAPAPPARPLGIDVTGGRSATVWLGTLFSVGRPEATPSVRPPAYEAPAAAQPTRASTDTLSLNAVFGDEPAPEAPATPSQVTEESGPSFDEFFGNSANPAQVAAQSTTGLGQPIEDLEQFNAWLKGLKR